MFPVCSLSKVLRGGRTFALEAGDARHSGWTSAEVVSDRDVFGSAVDFQGTARIISQKQTFCQTEFIKRAWIVCLVSLHDTAGFHFTKLVDKLFQMCIASCLSLLTLYCMNYCTSKSQLA